MALARPRVLLSALLVLAPFAHAQEPGDASAARGDSTPWVEYAPGKGSGNGKHIVFVTGDEEYRSEEACPMLAKILSVRHGFRCTVLFAIDPKTGAIDVDNQTNIPGLAKLDDADLMVIFTRFRELPDADMKHVDAFVNSGKPIVGLRTATHAFRVNRNKESAYAHYHFRAKEKWRDGFGREVLGETWVNHHGRHGSQSTRGVVAPGKADHPILRGVEDVWGPTDVYGVRDLHGDPDVLLLGQVVENMKPDGKPAEGKVNDPMMPLAWTKTFKGTAGKEARVFCTTMGAATDFSSEGLRRVLVNACYWGLGMEAAIPSQSDVRTVGGYEPTPFGFGKAKKGVMPREHALPSDAGK